MHPGALHLARRCGGVRGGGSALQGRQRQGAAPASSGPAIGVHAAGRA